MEAIRKIQTVQNGQIFLHLPKQFWGQEVEIIVLASPSTETQSVMGKKSLRGCLKRYANPGLIDTEQGAWQEIVGEKYERH